MNQEGASLTAIGRVIGTNKRHVKKFLRDNGETREFPAAWKGENCNQWKGGRIVDKDGYVLVYCPGHPNARKPDKRYVLEHRLVMERHLKRYLKPEEVIHHRNSKTQDNRIENLQLFSENSEHLRHELTGRCPNWTPKGKERMRQGVILSAKRKREQIRSDPKRGAQKSP